ncbi:MAG TPA: D-aminoacylase [Thermoanaerobaculia bacterium]|nr:D-aminoacylase [Thermoanaerobaculia bacterium]
MRRPSVLLAAILALAGAAALARAGDASFDVVIRGGTVYDGSGAEGRRADVGIRGDRIEAVGDLSKAAATRVVDATGLAVAPGFINMLSWSTDSLIVDGKSQSELRQGITTQIFGEGFSMGPLNDKLRKYLESQQTDFKYEMPWTTLAEYLAFLEKRGISQNVASYVGATTLRTYVIGLDKRAPTPAELDQMRELVRKEMEAGALGIGSALIYAPGNYASTEELIELCKVAAKYKGKYISHMRSEGDKLLEAIDELIRISKEAGLPAEIYHLKAAGQPNWPKMDQAIAKIEAARKSGLAISANMYTYTAGATSLDACVPPWAHDGGEEAMLTRLQDPETRAKIAAQMHEPGKDWENLCLLTGSPERVLLVEFGPDAMKPLTGKTLEELSKQGGKDWVDTALDLLIESKASIGAIYFLMSEDNVKKQIVLPWVSFGSDAGSEAPEGVFLKSMPHPRAYGNFARVLGKFVRDEKALTLPAAIRKLSSLPATNLGLDRRGFLKPGMFADVVVFDPATIADKATYEKPQQYAVGVRQVFTNGVQVLKDGEPTGSPAGRALKGPGAVAAPSAPTPAAH